MDVEVLSTYDWIQPKYRWCAHGVFVDNNNFIEDLRVTFLDSIEFILINVHTLNSVLVKIVG